MSALHSILNSRQRRAGFTLIELMITISIIAIISAIGLVSYSKAQSLGRDAKRKQDLASLAVALELYYQKNKTHPPLPQDVGGRGYGSGLDGCVSSQLQSLVPNYINSLTEDPHFLGGYSQPSTQNWCYYYYKGDYRDDTKQTYTLFARLEAPLPAGDPNECKPGMKGPGDGGRLKEFNFCFQP